jgi:hypothetical protein
MKQATNLNAPLPSQSDGVLYSGMDVGLWAGSIGPTDIDNINRWKAIGANCGFPEILGGNVLFSGWSDKSRFIRDELPEQHRRRAHNPICLSQ